MILIPLSLAFWSLVVYLVFGRGHAAASFRSGAPLIGAAIAMVALLASTWARGGYEVRVELFIGGPYAYTVETIERSFAGLWLGLGLIALALAAAGRWGGALIGDHPWRRACGLTVTVILLRVALEKLGVPLNVATFTGIIWLVAPLAVVFAVEAARRGRQRTFWVWLVSYALAIRVLVVAIMLLATHFELGTHFDNSGITRFRLLGEERTLPPHTWEQYRSLIVVPQLVLWTTVTLAGGAILGWPSHLVARRLLPRTTRRPES